MLIISNYNVTTALAIASTGGYVNTLFGTVLPMVPVLLPYLALVLLLFNRLILGALAVVATVLISPVAVSHSSIVAYFRHAADEIASSGWAVAIAVLAGLALLLMLSQLFSRGWTIFARSLGTIACILLVPVAFLLYPLPSSNSYYAHLVRQPWLPSETITLRSGATLTGYILSDDQDWTTVLNDSDRRIYYYRPEQMTGRQVCQPAGLSSKSPLVSLVTSTGPDLPTCGA